MTRRLYAALTIALALGTTAPSPAQAPAAAQPRQSIPAQPSSPPPRAGSTAARPAVGMGSKTMASCTRDTKKFCANSPAGVLTECLVANWDRISSDCQDALGTPSRAGVRGD